MSEKEETAEEREETMNDLDVPEEQSEGVTGGSKHEGEIDVLRR